WRTFRLLLLERLELVERHRDIGPGLLGVERRNLLFDRVYYRLPWCGGPGGRVDRICPKKSVSVCITDCAIEGIDSETGHGVRAPLMNWLPHVLRGDGAL